MVVSRAEELTSRILSYGFECEAGPLENCAEFQELIAVLAQRDKWIAELDKKVSEFREAADMAMGLADHMATKCDELTVERRAAVAAWKALQQVARAKVPEWCEKMIRDLRRGIAVHLVLDDIPKDQLRACGIEAP